MVWALASVHAPVLHYRFLQDGPFIITIGKRHALAVPQRSLKLPHANGAKIIYLRKSASILPRRISGLRLFLSSRPFVSIRGYVFCLRVHSQLVFS